MPIDAHYDVFISYARGDGDELARPLATGLQSRGLRVWFDEFVLRPGHDLANGVNEGLSRSRFGVVLVTPQYLEKRWPQRELNSLFALEMGGKCAVLPVLHQLTHDDLLAVSPLLACSVCLSSELGLENLISAISEIVGGDSPVADRASRVAGASHPKREPEKDQMPVKILMGRLADRIGLDAGGSEVGHFAGILARLMDFPEKFVQRVEVGASFRNFGMVGIPDSIKFKPGKLTQEEFEVMKSHTLLGAELMNDLGDPDLDTAAVIAATHHERWDGKGYPNSLAGEAIPVESRLVAVVDAFSAITRETPYRAGQTPEQALEYMERSVGHFDSAFLSTFLRNLDRFRGPGC